MRYIGFATMLILSRDACAIRTDTLAMVVLQRGAPASMYGKSMSVGYLDVRRVSEGFYLLLEGFLLLAHF